MQICKEQVAEVVHVVEGVSDGVWGAMDAFVWLHDGTWPVCKGHKLEKKKAVVKLAQSISGIVGWTVTLFRRHPDLLSNIPRWVLERLATVKLTGNYERKVLNAYVRFQDTYTETSPVDSAEASRSPLLRASERREQAISLHNTYNPDILKLADDWLSCLGYIPAWSEVLAWVLAALWNLRHCYSGALSLESHS